MGYPTADTARDAAAARVRRIIGTVAIALLLLAALAFGVTQDELPESLAFAAVVSAIVWFFLLRRPDATLPPQEHGGGYTPGFTGDPMTAAELEARAAAERAKEAAARERQSPWTGTEPRNGPPTFGG